MLRCTSPQPPLCSNRGLAVSSHDNPRPLAAQLAVIQLCCTQRKQDPLKQAPDLHSTNLSGHRRFEFRTALLSAGPPAAGSLALLVASPHPWDRGALLAYGRTLSTVRARAPEATNSDKDLGSRDNYCCGFSVYPHVASDDQHERGSTPLFKPQPATLGLL